MQKQRHNSNDMIISEMIVGKVESDTGKTIDDMVSRTKHIWYSEHGMYCWFKIILEWAMSVTHIAVIPRTRTHSDEEEFPKKWLSWRE